MRAAVVDRYGDPSVLRLVDLDGPQPAVDEILARTRLTHVTFRDAQERRGICAETRSPAT